MIRAFIIGFLLFSVAPSAGDGLGISTLIRLNTVGFLSGHQKVASIAVRCNEFSVVDDANTGFAFNGRVTGPVHNADTDEDIYLADFSTFNRTGLYHLEVPGVGRSVSFRIGTHVYDSAFRAAVQAMYLARCGSAVRAAHKGVTYSHAACHLEDAWLDYVGGGHVRKDGTGGWHDAGDYNKYVVNAGVSVGVMLLAWEQFEPAIQRAGLKLPDSPPHIPEYLSRVKWEMDWVLKMQAPDGSVYHKVSTKAFTGTGAPEDEREPRYFTPWSSAATADFVAMTAMSALVYRPYDARFSNRCLEAARKSYDFLKTHPGNHAADLAGFTTGAYQTGDADDRLWAAAELWETTGEAEYLRDFEARARAFGSKIDMDWGWSNVKNLGMLTYLFSKRTGRDQKLAGEIKDSLIATADGLVRAACAHGYARPLGNRYYWGCNGGVAGTTVLLQSANRAKPNPVYIETALDALGHLFGRNYFGRSFVTGVGANPPEHPHDRRSMGQPNGPAWPGYLVGGPWRNAKDWQDVSARYQMNEIAINWNAALIYALAGFVGAG